MLEKKSLVKVKGQMWRLNEGRVKKEKCENWVWKKMMKNIVSHRSGLQKTSSGYILVWNGRSYLRPKSRVSTADGTPRNQSTQVSRWFFFHHIFSLVCIHRGGESFWYFFSYPASSQLKFITCSKSHFNANGCNDQSKKKCQEISPIQKNLPQKHAIFCLRFVGKWSFLMEMNKTILPFSDWYLSWSDKASELSYMANKFTLLGRICFCYEMNLVQVELG